MKTWKVSVDALKKVHEGFSALDELALVAVPVALRNRFVVVDDIERKHASLSVDEVLGFVDEYSQNFGTRFLLILNSDQFSAPTDSTLWAAFREKVVEEELRFTPTPGEAFDIAVPNLNSPYRGGRVRDHQYPGHPSGLSSCSSAPRRDWGHVSRNSGTNCSVDCAHFCSCKQSHQGRADFGVCRRLQPRF